MSIRSAVESIPYDDAVRYLKSYYEPPEFTGAHFESLGAGDNPRDRITASDLYSVSTLSVTVPSAAGIQILGEESTTVSHLLKQIPTTELGALSKSDFDEHMGSESPALQLWDWLRRNGRGQTRWGIGPTTASKIMARKRPHLIPIEDSVVDRVIERGRRNSWSLWWEALTEDDYLENQAETLRNTVNRPDLSTLRILDVLLWMSGK